MWQKPPLLFPPGGVGGVYSLKWKGAPRKGFFRGGEKGGKGGANPKKMGIISHYFGPPPGFSLFMFPGCIFWGNWRGKKNSPREQDLTMDSPRGQINLNKREKKRDFHRGGAVLELGDSLGFGPWCHSRGPLFIYLIVYFFFFFYINCI
eukprot:FR735639.1.p2 GENE.FR735639.1~~FR735639.1.p2  ORF type:complete len:149 (-),score=64.22 FR735639.1:737-1183(-)